MFGTGKILATVVDQEAAVKKKPAQRFVWEKTRRQDPLYQRDSIQTGPGSRASLALTDGTTIDLGESSLIVIEAQEQLPLSYARGEVILHQKTGDQKITLTHTGKVLTKRFPVQLVSPGHLEKKTAGTAILFSWRFLPPEKRRPVLWQLSTEPHFLHLPKTQIILDETSHRVPLSPGDYFWRLLEPDSQAPLSTVKRFQVEPEPAPLAQKPLVQKIPAPSLDFDPSPEGTVVLTRTKETLPLSWKAVPLANAYQVKVEVWNESDQAWQTQASVTTSETKVQLDLLPEGTYRWAVKSLPEVPEEPNEFSAFLGFKCQYPRLLPAPIVHTLEVQ